jgi:hypothetical protein
MKSFNPSSLENSQSNIVAFNSKALKFRRQHSQSANSQISLWERIWERLFDWMMPSSQPEVTQFRERDNSEYYQVYDPVTGKSKTFGSELETRIWLDRRFYDNSRNW